jgi:ribosomal protein S19
MKLFYKNLTIYTEQGLIIPYKNKFRRLPFLAYSVFKNLFFIKNKKIIKIFKGSNKIITIHFIKIIQLYNGKTFKILNLNSLMLFKCYGQFSLNRIINSGKILHIKKKQLKK